MYFVFGCLHSNSQGFRYWLVDSILVNYGKLLTFFPEQVFEKRDSFYFFSGKDKKMLVFDSNGVFRSKIIFLGKNQKSRNAFRDPYLVLNEKGFFYFISPVTKTLCVSNDNGEIVSSTRFFPLYHYLNSPDWPGVEILFVPEIMTFVFPMRRINPGLYGRKGEKKYKKLLTREGLVSFYSFNQNQKKISFHSDLKIWPDEFQRSGLQYMNRVFMTWDKARKSVLVQAEGSFTLFSYSFHDRQLKQWPLLPDSYLKNPSLPVYSSPHYSRRKLFSCWLKNWNTGQIIYDDQNQILARVIYSPITEKIPENLEESDSIWNYWLKKKSFIQIFKLEDEPRLLGEIPVNFPFQLIKFNDQQLWLRDLTNAASMEEKIKKIQIRFE